MAACFGSQAAFVLYKKGNDNMTIEDLIKEGKTKEEILSAVGNAYDLASGNPDPNPNPEPNSNPEPNPDQPTDLNAMIAQLTQMQMQTNQQILELQKQIIENSKDKGEEDAPGEPDDSRKFSDEKLTEALQKLNLLSDNDKIDINKQVEDNLVSHLGSLVGFSTKGEEKK